MEQAFREIKRNSALGTLAVRILLWYHALSAQRLPWNERLQGAGSHAWCASLGSIRRADRDRSRRPGRLDASRNGALRPRLPGASLSSRGVPSAPRSPAGDAPVSRDDSPGGDAARRHECAAQVLPPPRAHHVAARVPASLLAQTLAAAPLARATGRLQGEIPDLPRAALRPEYRHALLLSRAHAPPGPRWLPHRHSRRRPAQGDHR